MHEARQYIKKENNAVQCTLCSHRCRIAEGKHGICGVRRNTGGTLYAETYGLVSAEAVDPLEKKPLYHFLPGTLSYSLGGIGCNFKCRHCQNWEISRARSTDGLSVAVSPAAVAEAAKRTGCRSVAFTYNEPIVTLEYVVEVAAACRAAGLRTVAVTAGYISEAARGEFFAAMDAANVDLKGFSDDFYRRVCSASLQPVLDTLAFIAGETEVWQEITTLLIPGLNDSDDEVASIARFIAENLSPDVPLHLSAFHPDHKMRDVPPTPAETLTRARRVAMAEGLRFVYTANVRDSDRGTTFCPACGAAVIVRDWYDIEGYELDADGRCLACGAQIPGVFDGPAGTWGRRRAQVPMPVPHGPR